MKYSEADLQQLAALLGGSSEEARQLMAAAQTEMERRAAATLQTNPDAGRVHESEYAALRMQAETLGVPFEEYLREMAILRAFARPVAEERSRHSRFSLEKSAESEVMEVKLPPGEGSVRSAD